MFDPSFRLEDWFAQQEKESYNRRIDSLVKALKILGEQFNENMRLINENFARIDQRYGEIDRRLKALEERMGES